MRCAKCLSNEVQSGQTWCGSCSSKSALFASTSPSDPLVDVVKPASDKVAEAPRIGDLIAENYRLYEVVGRGGMAVVYVAEDKRLQRLVAIKIMLETLVMDSQSRPRFQREARIMASLEHDHIAPVYMVGEHRGFPFFVTKLLNGKNLSVLANAGRLSFSRVVRLLTPIAEALDYCHSRGLIHRDVKPSNIFIGENDKPWLVDFGISKHLTDSALTRSGTLLGTLAYAPPESVVRAESVAASDQYSLALVAYQLMTLKFPFSKSSDFEVTQQKLLGANVDLSEVPEASAASAEVFSKAFSPEPTNRFESCVDFMRALGASLVDSADRGLESLAATESSLERVPSGELVSRPPVKRRTGVILVTLGLLGTSGLVWWQIATTSSQPSIDLSATAAPPRAMALPEQDPTWPVQPIEGARRNLDADLDLSVSNDADGSEALGDEVLDAGRLVTSAEFDAGSADFTVKPLRNTTSAIKIVRKARFGEVSMQALRSTGGAVSSRILLDGQDRGLTPAVLKEVSAGKHTVVFSQAGYQSKRQFIFVKAGQQLRVVVTLLPE
jgi:serine/threonine protein kinase